MWKQPSSVKLCTHNNLAECLKIKLFPLQCFKHYTASKRSFNNVKNKGAKTIATMAFLLLSYSILTHTGTGSSDSCNSHVKLRQSADEDWSPPLFHYSFSARVALFAWLKPREIEREANIKSKENKWQSACCISLSLSVSAFHPGYSADWLWF